MLYIPERKQSALWHACISWTTAGLASILTIYAIGYLALVGMKSFSLAGHRWFLLGDDAMISMRYARNLVNGEGLVWNAGERVEGFTNPLWTLLMAVAHLLPIPYYQVSLLIQLMNLFLGVGIILLSYKLALVFSRDGQKRESALLASMIVAGYLPLVYWGVLGFETSLLAVLVTAAWIDVVERMAHPLRPFLILTFATLVRPDALIFFVPAGLAYLLDRRWSTKEVVVAALMSIGIIALAECLRLLYYGEALPNTYYLKAEAMPFAGLHYMAKFMIGGGAILALILLAGVVRTRSVDGAIVLGSFSAICLYSVVIGGDAFPLGRYMLAFTPAAIVAGFVLGGRELVALLHRRERDVQTLATLAVILLLGLNLWAVRVLIPDVINGTFGSEDARNAAIGEYLRHEAGDDAVVAVFWAGTVPYVRSSGR
jgi:hypothetical protein